MIAREFSMARSRLLALVPGLALALTACAGEPPSGEEPSSVQAERFGLISVTYGHDWAETGEGMLLSTAAQFVRYSDLNRAQVGRLLALPLDPDRDLPAVDHCRIDDLSVDLKSSVPTEPESGSLELLEAGDLQVQTPSRNIRLAPKHFPGLLPFISGVIYGEAEASLVEAVGKVRASSSGGEAVGAFVAQLGSPGLPRLEQVGGSGPSQAATLTHDRDLTLRWQRASDTQLGDVLYLELRFSKGSRDQALRCRPEDDGSFAIPQALLAEVSGPAVLEIARLRRTAFVASGLDQAELRVTVRDAANLQ
jgi:hypothetical protein